VSSPVLEVDLQAGYGRSTVLQQVAFRLHAGERLGLLGPSGTGKSTLLLALLGLLPLRGGWARGSVLLDGRNVLELPKREARALRGRAFALVPQSPLSALNPALSLQTHFEQAWKAHRPADAQQLASRVAALLRRVDLPGNPEFLKRKPGQISVGQAQRCTLALALLHGPAVLIADEPTSALDPVTQTEVIDLLREITTEQGTALLFVSHDLLSVLRLCSSIAVLSAGRIGEHLPVDDIVLATDPALRQLLRTLPVPAEVVVEHARLASRKPASPAADETAHALVSK
jgi:ABC-type glutathione transport system ATPase component